MRLILTRKELVSFQEMALKMHKVTGVVLQELGEELDQRTLLMTDSELISELENDFMEDMNAIGAKIICKKDENGVTLYTVDVPEDFIAYMCKTSTEMMTESAGFLIKSVRFINKYKNVFVKLLSYIRSIASTLGPIFEANEAKDIQKDFDELEENFYITKNRLSLIAEANEALYALDEY